MKQHAPGLFESMKLLDSDEIEDVENQYELVVMKEVSSDHVRAHRSRPRPSATSPSRNELIA